MTIGCFNLLKIPDIISYICWYCFGRIKVQSVVKILIPITLSVILALPYPVFSSVSGDKIPLDTSKLYRLVFNGNRSEAAHYLHQTMDIRSNRSAASLAEGWLETAIFYAWSKKTDQSDEAFKNFLRYMGQSSGSLSIRSNCLLYHALSLSAAASFNQAADSLLTSIAIRPMTGGLNKILLADSYGELARLYKKTEDLYESSRNFDRSISLNKEMGRESVLAADLSDLSSVLSKMNSSDKRIETLLNESLAIYQKQRKKKAGNTETALNIAQVYNEFGFLYLQRNQYREALKNYKLSLNEKLKIHGLQQTELIVVNNNIGACYEYLKIADSSRYYYQKAVDYSIKSHLNPADYYANLGVSFGAKDEYTKALVFFQKALNSIDSSCSDTNLSENPGVSKTTPQLADYTAYKAHSFHRRYNIHHDPKDLSDGLQTFMVALEMMDTLRFMYSFESKPYLASEAKIHFFNALDMAMDLFELTGDKKYLEQAFLLSERNKSATLNEFLRTNQARQYMGKIAPWIKVEDSIKQLINKTESRLIGLSAEPGPLADSIRSLQTRISLLTDQLKNIDIEARRANPEYFQNVYSNHGYLPGDIQKILNPGEAMIDYTVIKDTRLQLDFMIVVVLTRDTLYTYRDTLPSQFRKDINAFRATITSYVDAKVFRDFCRLSNLMYEYFFAPVEKFKGIDQLIILPDEELGFLPFEVFVSDTLKPKGSDFRKLSYLNKKYQISYISSHEQLYQFRKNSGKKGKATIYTFSPFASQGCTIDSLTLFPLGNSGSEAKSLSRYFKTRVFENRKAGEQSLRRAFQEESIINLSTHGIMDSTHPMQSRLLLNPSEPDGSLYLFEIMSLKINSSLVILNACNTGTGKLQVGEGIMSLARGFQYAGVPSVITTLWPVDDQSSSTVMKLFFKNIYAGMGQREALMKARNTYISQATKANGAPYFWAGQVLIGNPGSISINHGIRHLEIVFILIVTALTLILVLVFHKKKQH